MSTPRKPLGEAEFNQLFHTYHKPVFLYLRTLLARRGHPPDPHLVEDLLRPAGRRHGGGRGAPQQPPGQ